MKSQAIFKSIENLSDSRILDIYLRVLKKEERTTGAFVNLRRRAPDGNQCYFILIQKEKRKQGKAQGKAQDSKQKKKKKRKRRKKKTPCRIRTPGPQSRRSEFFCASHH